MILLKQIVYQRTVPLIIQWEKVQNLRQIIIMEITTIVIVIIVEAIIIKELTAILLEIAKMI